MSFFSLQRQRIKISRANVASVGSAVRVLVKSQGVSQKTKVKSVLGKLGK